MKKTLRYDDLSSICGKFCYLKGEFVLENDKKVFRQNGIRIETKEVEKAGGVIERIDTIINDSDETIELTSALARFTLSDGDYEVYTQYSEWCNESRGRWQPLYGEIFGRNDDLRPNCPIPPFVAVYNKQNQKGYAFHMICDGKYQYSVRRRYIQGYGGIEEIVVELGYLERDFYYELKPGESLQLPKMLYYQFDNKVDMDAYKLHRYANVKFPASSLPIIFNSWMSNFDSIDFDSLDKQLTLAKELGIEYFVVDAGWFGAPPYWFELVGDWEEYLENNMKGRLAEFSKKVEKSGLKFGLWFEIERATLTCNNVKKYPQYYVIEDGGAYIDFSNPEAVSFVLELVSEKIRQYSIKFIKFDYNREYCHDLTQTSFIKHFKGYEYFLRSLRERFPDLYLECCASGGLRMALSGLRNFNSFWMSDNHSIYDQAEIFKNTLIRMPSRALEKWITIESAKDFRYSYSNRNSFDRLVVCCDSGWETMRSVSQEYLQGASVGGPLGLSFDLSGISKDEFDKLKDFIKVYKSEENFWKDSECRILVDGEGLTVLQFNDREFNKIKIYVYNYKRYQRDVTVYPVCDDDSQYVLGDKTYEKGELSKVGIRLNTGDFNSSLNVEILKIK